MVTRLNVGVPNGSWIADITSWLVVAKNEVIKYIDFGASFGLKTLAGWMVNPSPLDAPNPAKIW